MIICNSLTMEHGHRRLFLDVDLNLLKKNRYAVVGANGSGKSTFLKLLAQVDHPSKGAIDISNRLSIGFLKQDHFASDQKQIIDVVIEGKPKLAEAWNEKERILLQDTITDEDGYRLGELEETILSLDGYSGESQAAIILQGLGIDQSLHRQPLSVLSGGYKLRVLLAQALFQNPDILLLDEPTNHLDIASIDWLESFLVESYQGLLVFISHDREFTNGVATHILDIDYETITLYTGNYNAFVVKKEEVLEQKKKEFSHKQKQIDTMQTYVDRFRASASRSKQAMSRAKMIERIELPDVKKTSRIQPNFNFTFQKPSGKQVLEIEGLTQAFGGKTLFKDMKLVFQKGQKCAVVGPNGVGKSTLLKIIMSQLPPDAGVFRWNDTARVGYFAQDFHGLLDPDQTLLEWLKYQVNKVDEVACRKALGRMLFSGQDVEKRIRVLSGGECARLVFAKLMLEENNVLIFDEPTNHLDMEAIDGLVEGLKAYTGTVIFVSHNRYLVQKVAQSLLVMTPKRVQFYPGTYQEYLDKMGKDYLLMICGNKV